MRFQPKTEKELAAMNLIQPGIYDFEVWNANDKTSKSGNEMIELKLKIWDHSGQERIIFDYLLEVMAFKLKHFADTTGLSKKYEEGIISALDCIGKCGKLDLIIQKDKSGQYADKNTVKDYIVEAKSTDTPGEDKIFDDEIPF